MHSALAIASIILGGTITPGPNNLALLQIAGRGGSRAALSAIAAIVAGGLALYSLVHLGLDAWASQRPWAQQLMLAGSAGYLVWLGGTLIYRSFRPATAQGSPAAPMSAFALLAFQLVNPKAWLLMVSVSAATHCVQVCTRSEEMLPPLLLMVIPTVSLLSWLVLSMGMRRLSGLDPSKPTLQRLAGVLLIASAASLTGA